MIPHWFSWRASTSCRSYRTGSGSDRIPDSMMVYCHKGQALYALTVERRIRSLPFRNCGNLPVVFQLH